MGENIGAAARAMLNFGLTDLRIVAPRDGWPNQAATDNGAGAFDVIDARVFDTLQEALADCHYAYATTARLRDMVKPVMRPAPAMDDAKARAAEGQNIALVFGPERTGLENDDVALCHALINVPTNPDFSSLNLAQCVLLIAYAWHSAGDAQKSSLGENLPATQEKQEEFFKRLEEELESSGFFRDEGLKPTMVRNIRNMLSRGEMTDQELRTFHGMISALIGKKSQQ